MRRSPAIAASLALALGIATHAWAFLPERPTPTPTSQTQPLPADAFQIRYAANLDAGDAVVNLSNAGTHGGTESDHICANVYVFTPDESMIECCACSVTPNALVSLSARTDLISNPLTPITPPTSIVIKVLATGSTAPCNASAPTLATLVSGLRVWGSTVHPLPTSPVTYAAAETEFSRAGLSRSELLRLTSECSAIQMNGSGAGVCNSCRTGGL